MLSWRRKKSRAHHKELEIPRHFLCPISLDLMKDPVTLCSGITYDRESIETWLEHGNFTCPVANQPLRSFDQIPNHSLRKMIQDWCVGNQKHGIQRIPTPRIPVTSEEVSEILFAIWDSNRRLDQCGCLHSLHKIKKWCTESERNRRCLLSNDETPGVLAAAFDAFATDSFEIERNAIVLEEILCVLNWMFPLSKEAQLHLGSQASLRCMVWFLKYCKDISVKQNSMIALQELLSCDHKYVQELGGIDGVNEMLFKFIKDPVCPSITKASLMVIFYMVSANDKIKSEFVEMGLVSLLLETIVESERSVCERALGVVDQLCDSKQGREVACNNALAMPVLVKKILRVSDLATEYSVSTIRNLCKYENKYEQGVLIEALQVGAFQKLLLLIQVGCGDKTKEKATELLKLLNPYRAGLECIDSVDFKSLKRSF